MWFRRNKTERQYLKLAEGLIPLLGIQRTLTPDFALEADGAVNKAALGYAYGFIDSAAQIAGLEINCVEGRQLIGHVLDFLQEGRGEFLMSQLSCLGQDKEFKDWVATGGTEYNNWVKSKGTFQPMGLGRPFRQARG